jgi:Spy/CpxP family protein refolding chaperone
MIRTIRSLVFSASILASMTAAWAGTATAAPGQAQAEADGGSGHHHGRHHHGNLLHASLQLPSLSSAQRQQIEALLSQERSAHANVESARAALLTAVASGIDAGKVDPTSLQPKVSAVASAIAADEPGEDAALEKLHAILTPAQRTELVQQVTSHMGHTGGDAGRRDGGAGRGHGGGPGGPLGTLNLSDAQKQQIHTAMQSAHQAPSDAEKNEMKTYFEARKQMLQAFEGDRFVMRELVPPKPADAIQREADRIVTLASAATPVLTADQRSTASAKLRAMAARTTSR